MITCVARPVGKREMMSVEAARVAMTKEWDRLRHKYVWDEEHPEEWEDVRRRAARDGTTVHM